jgi:hypothetical protein
MDGEAMRGATVPYWLGTSVASLLLVAVVAGCGSGGKESSNATPAPTKSAMREPSGAPVDRRPVAVQVRVADRTSQPFADTAEARSGDYVQLRTLVRTAADAPPRRLSITVARRGTGAGLKVRARPTSGGKGSTATITSASGGALKLAQLRYSCFAPPAPTFCPLSSVRATGSRYVVTAKVRRGHPVVLTLSARTG